MTSRVFLIISTQVDSGFQQFPFSWAREEEIKQKY